MALSDINFQLGQGALGRPLPGEDYISGFLTYINNGDLPSGFTTTNRIKQFYSISDAENAGILNDYSDATAAQGQIVVDTIGSNGDKAVVSVVEISPSGVTRTVVLCTYIKASTETTENQVSDAMAVLINAGTITHGYSAVSTTGTINLVFPKRLGIYPNTGSPIVTTITGTIFLILSQPGDYIAGTYSKLAIWHYHIAEFFRQSPSGILFFGFFAFPEPYTYTEITTMQDFADGKLRQIGIFKNDYFSDTSEFTVINTVCEANATDHAPLSALVTSNIVGGDLNVDLPSLATLTANKVSFIIGQDGAGQGNYLYLTSGISISQLGCALGAVAAAKVSECIGWVGGFNLSDGYENEVLAFSNGQSYASISGLIALQTALDTKRYIFARKFRGKNGSYFNSDHTAIAPSSDYAYIRDNRTIDKAIRLLYAGKLLNDLNGEIDLQGNGYLTAPQQSIFESDASTSLDQMVRDGEISAYSVTVNPNQDVLTTGTLVVGVKILPNGVARQIVVPISFTRSI
jgi:hypothetical protein